MPNKLSRICWNTNNWKFPSGPNGKSKASQSYECKYGFGHEEWLLDNTRIIDGFHFAFLQPLSLNTDRHVGKTYRINLFTILNSTRYFVGTINNAICISKEESKKVYGQYKKKGWLKEMVAELKNAGTKSIGLEQLKNTPPEIYFNLKFKFSDYTPTQSGDLEKISNDCIDIRNSRYVLLPQNNDLVFATETSEHQGNFQNAETRTMTITGRDTTFDPHHPKIQNALCELLRSNEYSKTYQKVDIETDRVDVKALTCDGQWHFYEIKTVNFKENIRCALGQLLEYAYYPQEERASRLVIVAIDPPNQDAKTYLKHIRNKFKIPIYYQRFSIEKRELSELY